MCFLVTCLPVLACPSFALLMLIPASCACRPSDTRTNKRSFQACARYAYHNCPAVTIWWSELLARELILFPTQTRGRQQSSLSHMIHATTNGIISSTSNSDLGQDTTTQVATTSTTAIAHSKSLLASRCV